MAGKTALLETNCPLRASSSAPRYIFSRKEWQPKERDTAHSFGSRRQWHWLRRDHHETEGEEWISGAPRERDAT